MEIPKAVSSAFETLKKNSEGHLVLKRIGNGFYVYKETGLWDKSLKKTRAKFEYLGKMTIDGIFRRKNQSELENAKLVIESYGGKVTMPEKNMHRDVPTLQLHNEEKAILTILSMNGRAPLRLISRHTGLQSSTLYNKIKKIKIRYGIKYIAEMDTEKLGYRGYLTFVKFKDATPDSSEMKKILENDPHVQLAAITTGEYDLIVYFLAKNNRDMAFFVYDLRSLPVFSDCQSDWYVTPLHISYNMIPVRDRFFDLLKEKIWVKSRAKARPSAGELLEREYLLLKELNSNGIEDFSTIDEKHALANGTARYTYQKLKEAEFLKRVTISMGNLSLKYHAVIIFDYLNIKEFNKTRANVLSEIIKDGHVGNKYALSGDIEIPEGGILILPVLKDDDLNAAEMHIEKNVLGIRLRRLIITRIIVGSFCYRNLDKHYSNQYKILTEDYKIEKAGKGILYDE